MAPRAPKYVSVELDKSPDEIANALFNGMLTDDPLVSVDLRSATGEEGLALFMAILVRRLAQRSLERDEVVAFVEENRAILEREGWIRFLLDKLPEVDADDEADGAAMMRTMRDAATQMQLALDHRPDDIQVISNRLLYLCIALAMKLGRGDLTHEAAVSGYLARPTTRALMSKKAVLFMLSDYLRNMDDIDEPDSSYVMLVAECALFTDDVSSIAVAATLLRDLPPPVGAAPWLDLRQRLAARLRSCGLWNADHEASLAKAINRFADVVADDDL